MDMKAAAIHFEHVSARARVWSTECKFIVKAQKSKATKQKDKTSSE